MRELEMQIGKTEYIHGNQLTAILEPVPTKTFSDTAEHEAIHVVVARENGTGVESASIIPGEGYLGITKLSRPDPVAALGPHAMGKSGTDFDVLIAGGAAGAEGAARSIASGNQEKIEAVAIALEENGTIFSSDIEEAIQKAENPVIPAFIIVKSPEGEVKKVKGEAKGGIITVFEELSLVA